MTVGDAGGDRSTPPTDEARLAAQRLKEAAGGGLGGERAALARLEEASTALLEGAGRALPPWAARAADTLLSAWG
ncbi:MAG TPA: hypothetical protein VJ622_10105, partial [Acidimicrobiia bacterium]|nr:hypothetical protein [Acidimicrobiia bacterium]